MFTGIIESLAKLVSIEKNGDNITFTFNSKISNELKIDQSLAHNGICLTVVDLKNNNYSVVAIKESVLKTSIKNCDTQFINKIFLLVQQYLVLEMQFPKTSPIGYYSFKYVTYK